MMPQPVTSVKTAGSWPVVIVQFMAMALILTALISVSRHALGYPLYEWDAFAIWGLKAKVLFHDSLLSRPAYFYDVNLSYSHLDYPLGMPFLTSGAYAALGETNDQWGKILFPCMLAAYILMLFDGFRRILNPTRSLIIVAVCVGNGPVMQWSGSGNADLFLTVYYGGSVLYLLRWLKDRQSSDIIISALLSAFCAFTKNEGVALACINLFFLLVQTGISRRKNDFVAAGYFFSILVILTLPWSLWRMGIPGTHVNYWGLLNISHVIGNMDRLDLIFYQFLQHILRFERWGGMWLLMVAFSLIGWRAFSNPQERWCWLLFAAHIALYVLIFVITPWQVDHLAESSLDRLLMHVIPVVGLISSYHWASFDVVSKK